MHLHSSLKRDGHNSPSQQPLSCCHSKALNCQSTCSNRVRLPNVFLPGPCFHCQSWAPRSRLRFRLGIASSSHPQTINQGILTTTMFHVRFLCWSLSGNTRRPVFKSPPHVRALLCQSRGQLDVLNQRQKHSASPADHRREEAKNFSATNACMPVWLAVCCEQLFKQKQVTQKKHGHTDSEKQLWSLVRTVQTSW